jgi:hypothetical protein
MTFNAPTFQKDSAKLEIDDIDFDTFKNQSLNAKVLRCLAYLQDIESHIVRYLRDVLVTRAHRHPCPS